MNEFKKVDRVIVTKLPKPTKLDEKYVKYEFSNYSTHIAKKNCFKTGTKVIVIPSGFKVLKDSPIRNLLSQYQYVLKSNIIPLKLFVLYPDNTYKMMDYSKKNDIALTIDSDCIIIKYNDVFKNKKDIPEETIESLLKVSSLHLNYDNIKKIYNTNIRVNSSNHKEYKKLQNLIIKNLNIEVDKNPKIIFEKKYKSDNTLSKIKFTCGKKTIPFPYYKIVKEKFLFFFKRTKVIKNEMNTLEVIKLSSICDTIHYYYKNKLHTEIDEIVIACRIVENTLTIDCAIIKDDDILIDKIVSTELIPIIYNTTANVSINNKQI